MNMEELIIEEITRAAPGKPVGPTLLAIASRCVRTVEALRDRHGHDAVVINPGGFEYVSLELDKRHFYGARLRVDVDADRIEIAKPVHTDDSRAFLKHAQEQLGRG